MKKVLITGATGNVGIETIKSLLNIEHDLELYAGVRELNRDENKPVPEAIKVVHFDFLDSNTYQQALDGCDILFLIRPPQISAVKKYFKPLIDTCIKTHIKYIVFLSVQGVEKSRIIPHYKIEKLIKESKIPYTFLRPAYFMQNFTTTLREELVHRKRIYLPAGRSKFTLIDVRDIGAVAANVLTNMSDHVNKTYELTSDEKLTFSEMARLLSNYLGRNIYFESPSLINFFILKRKEHVPSMFILVMIMLHYFPRFQQEPETTDWVKKITKRNPITFEQFVIDHKTLLI